MQLIPSIILKHLEGRTVLKSIVANTGWLFADRILRMGVGLFVGVWVARYLGVEQFGLFSYALAFVTLFSTLATLGLPSLVIRSITHEPKKREEILGTTFWLQLFGGIATLVLAVATMFVLGHENQLMLSMVAILASATVFQAFRTIDLWFQSQVMSKYTVMAQNAAFLTISILRVFLINIQAPLLAFAGANFAEVVIGSVWLVLFYKLQGYSIWAWRWSLSLAKTLIKESWPLILSGLTVTIYMKADQIMLGAMHGAQAVGLYSAAARISEVWYFIPTAIASSVAPAIYASKKEDNESLYYWRIEKLLKVLSVIAILIALPMTFASKIVITQIFGNEYAAASPILSIHIWAAWFVFMGVGTSSWFIAEGLTQLSFRRTLLGGIVNIILNFFLIPTYGGTGAAIATVFSQASAAFFFNRLNVKTQRIFQLQLKSIFLSR